MLLTAGQKKKEIFPKEGNGEQRLELGNKRSLARRTRNWNYRDKRTKIKARQEGISWKGASEIYAIQ